MIENINVESARIKASNTLKRINPKLKRLEDIFVEETRLRVKTQQPRVIKIKTMKKIDASVSPVKYQEEVF